MQLRTFIMIGLLSVMGLDLFAQEEVWTEEQIYYNDRKYKFNFMQGLFNNPTDPDFLKTFYSYIKLKSKYNRPKKSKEPLPWVTPPPTVPLDVYEEIINSISLSVPPSDKDDCELAVHLQYAFPKNWLNNAEMKGDQNGTYEYFDWPEYHGLISSIGIQAKRADGVEFRFISRMVDHENEPVLLVNQLGYERKLIRDNYGNCLSVNETYTLRLDKPLSQVKEGTLLIGIPKKEYQRVKITDSDTNRQFTLGQTPFTVLSFKNGNVVICCDYHEHYLDEITEEWMYIGMKNGVRLKHPDAGSYTGYPYTLYKNMRNNPNYSLQDFMVYDCEKDPDQRMVYIFTFHAPVNEVYFYINPIYNETMLEREIKVK